MARSVDVSGASIVYLFYAASLAIVPVVVHSVVLPVDDAVSVFVAGALAALVLVVVADCWYWRSGATSDHLTAAAKRNLPYDVTYDPTADPGQAAKQRWLQAVRRLPGRDDEDEG
ncbi:hypothetical protein [Halobacterium yunchengense]|uniref:hypothetical protein n=1 Tax=Halobacterium yunchengense TaxID=3108497 RepID=UPI0030095E09